MGNGCKNDIGDARWLVEMPRLDPGHEVSQCCFSVLHLHHYTVRSPHLGALTLFESVDIWQLHVLSARVSLLYTTRWEHNCVCLHLQLFWLVR